MLRNLILIFIAVAYVVGAVLDYLNHRAAARPVHPDLSDLFAPEELRRQRAYSAARYRAGVVSTAISTAILVAAVATGWFGRLDAWLRGYLDNEILLALAFFAVLGLISECIGLPSAIYSTFSIEQRFGFNTTTRRTFVLDLFKGLALGALIGGVLLAVIVWLQMQLQSWFWLAGWAVFSAFSLFMFMFGTSLVLPVFNTLTPVEPGELRSAIAAYCESQGYALGRLFIMDGSKRSTKANAFFTGLGRSKTIVLFDTLVERSTIEEVVAVLAHEIGHYRLRHTLQSFVLSNLQTLFMFGLLGWMLHYPDPALALGGEAANFHLSALAFLLLLSPMNLLLAWGNNTLSRHNELAADAFAKRTYAGLPLASALRKMAHHSLTNPTPHPWFVAVHYTHPPLQQRLARLR